MNKEEILKIINDHEFNEFRDPLFILIQHLGLDDLEEINEFFEGITINIGKFDELVVRKTDCYSVFTDEQIYNLYCSKQEDEKEEVISHLMEYKDVLLDYFDMDEYVHNECDFSYDNFGDYVKRFENERYYIVESYGGYLGY